MRSFYYAFRGIVSVFRSEVNMRIHVVAAVLATVAGFYFKIAAGEWGIVVLCICSVIAMELINTAIEQLCNHVTAEQHPVIKKVKDIAAAAVLVTAVGSFVVALIIFLPKLISLF
ncbi:diacylglycerol kinase family protein [Lacibacter sp.]|uniref:diacylglycerol kinase family protein n=1 Tax=Lacibacter sp. TaxID=1915409 RepID=UPI002B4B8F10|nr:diacylglycerol kinase family protein [Lacibacter sp.]HLP37411.1 diacylglycerol kinase family protein [Lacibacter sp.]